MAVSRSPILRLVLFVAGTLSLGIGAVAVVIRGIPTTPFLLLAVGCYSRSSERMHRWIYNHPRFGLLLRDLKEGRGLTLRVKLTALLLAWLAIGGFAIFVARSLHLRLFLVGLVVVKTIVMVFVLPTKPSGTAPDVAVSDPS